MRVPVRRAPETRISERQQGYARPVTPLNLSPFNEVIEGFRDQLLDEQDARQRVELNRRLLTEVNELQTDFVARQRDPEVSPIDFAANTNTAYTTRHAALIAELRQGGYSQDLLDDFDARLGTVRQGFMERGLTHQVAQLTARADEEIEELGVSASQYAAVDPVNNYATARDMVRNSIRAHPDLLEDQRATLEDRELAVVRNGAAAALAIQNPQLVVDTFDPQGLTAPHPTTPPAAATAAGPTAEVAPAANTGQRYVNGWSPRRRNGGDNTDAQVDTYISTLARGLGVTPDTRLTEANLPQMAQIMARVESGGAPSARSVRNNNPGNIEDGRFARSQPGYAGGDGRFARFNSPQDGQNAQVTLLRRYLNRGQVTVRSIIEGVPAGGQRASRPAPTGSGGGGGGGEPDAQTDASTAVRPEAENLTAGLASIRTGNALLDDLNGPERMQLLIRARERLTQQTASQRAAMDVRIGNIIAEVGNGIATPAPTEQELIALYGPVEGPQRHAQVQQAIETDRVLPRFRTQSAANIQRELDAIRPTPGTPTYAAELQIYNAAEQAAQRLLTERQQDPAAYALRYFPSVREAAGRSTAQYYAALDRAYEALGIDARNAPLLTTEATQNINRNYRGMNPQQRRQFIQENMEGMGPARFRRFVRDMEGTTAESDAHIFALLRHYPGAGAAGNLYNEILEGREIIAQDPARRPRAEEVTEVFRRVGLASVRDLDAETSRSIQEAAEGLYARRGGDPVNINQTLYREALAQVLGGNLPANMTRGAVTSYTILPPRVSEGQFRNWMERQTTATLTQFGTARQPPVWGDLRTPVPMQTIIDEGVFVMVSPGYYSIRMSSDGRPLMTRDGNRYIMRINSHGLMSLPSRSSSSRQVNPMLRPGGVM